MVSDFCSQLLEDYYMAMILVPLLALQFLLRYAFIEVLNSIRIIAHGSIHAADLNNCDKASGIQLS